MLASELPDREAAGSQFRRSQRVEPSQQIGITFPSRWLAASQGWIDLLQCFSLRLQVGLRIVVGRIEVSVAQPASNHRDINAGRYQMDGSCVAKHMWCDSLLG